MVTCDMQRITWLSLALTILLLVDCTGTRQKAGSILGYRVQICFTESMEDAQRCRDRIKEDLSHTDIRVYTVFEAPYYKIRVGDFLQWDDAYQLQTWLRNELGYNDAWVVPSQVAR